MGIASAFRDKMQNNFAKNVRKRTFDTVSNRVWAILPPAGILTLSLTRTHSLSLVHSICTNQSFSFSRPGQNCCTISNNQQTYNKINNKIKIITQIKMNANNNRMREKCENSNEIIEHE